MEEIGGMWEVGCTPWRRITSCDGRRGLWFVATTVSCWEYRRILCFKDSGILGRAGLFSGVSKDHLSSEMPGNIDLNPKRHTAKNLSSH